MHPHETDKGLAYREIFRAAFGDLRDDESIMSLIRNVHHAYHVMDSAHEEYLKPFALTGAKLRMLTWLLACDKVGYADGLLPSQLSRFQNVSPNTVSSLLAGLEDQRWIERTKHPTDNRKQIITITDSGRTLLQSVFPKYKQFIDSTMIGLSREEREILVTLLNKLTQSMQDALQTTTVDGEVTKEMPPPDP